MAKAKQKKAKATQKKEQKKVTKAKKEKKAPKAKTTPKKKAEATPKKQPKVEEKKEKELKEKELGEVSNYFEHVQAAAIKLAAPLKVGDSVHIKGGEVDFEQKVESMQINKVPVTSAKKGDEVGIKVSKHVRKGYKVYLK